MITKHDLLEAIAECQGQRHPNANTCLKLAAFYTIMDHMDDEDSQMDLAPQAQAYSFADGIIRYRSDTDFGQIIVEKDVSAVFSVLDELMNTLQVLHPRLYNATLDKLDAL